ncbi:RnfH family protein [Pseudomonas sp. Pseusp122]|uniref:RnfH family protein n=1 Tax=unclassified Pseudomonas TaxID=196821 RepID=UPI0039A4986A
MPEVLIEVEVVCAMADRQVLISLELPGGSTARQAIQASAIQEQFADLDISQCAVGIFGKVIGNPEQRLLEAGDRVEIYRPLLADPKEIRRLRAAKAAKARADGESS